jgi:hypothetical protein
MKTKSKKIIKKLTNQVNDGITISDDCYDFIEYHFTKFWKKEWNKLEGEINQFAFKFYKEGFKQALKEKKWSRIV